MRREHCLVVAALGVVLIVSGCAQTIQPGTGVPATSPAYSPLGAMIDPAMVQWAQRALQEAGFDPGPASGELTARTAVALRDFQRVKGLPATGALDDRTTQYLATATGLTVPGSRSEPMDVE